MSLNQAGLAQDLPRDVSDARATSWFGTLLAAGCQAVLLVSVIIAYVYLGSGSEPWPPVGIGPPDVLVAGIGTVLLLASAVPMAWASAGIRQGDQRRLKLGLALSFVLGAGFLGIAGYEYVRQEFEIETNAYASSFLVLLAFHALQVAIGLVMSGLVQLWAWLGYYDARRHLAVQNTALNWYYVVASWLVIFAVLYLSPHVLD